MGEHVQHKLREREREMFVDICEHELGDGERYDKERSKILLTCIHNVYSLYSGRVAESTINHSRN